MKILFQGDSITDAGRSREDDRNLGSGYANLVAARLGFEMPGCHTFVNRGIGGDRIPDLVGRMERDILRLKPDVVSILIGVNDVWHGLGWDNGVEAELFEELYTLLIRQLQKKMPDLRILIMEPFVLPGSATREHWDVFSSEVALRAQAAKRVAEAHGLQFVPLQHLFDEATEQAPGDYWLIDGVHPSAAGHELIAREWVKAFFA